jgi:hypothetical protein
VRDALARADDGVDPYTRVRLYWSLARLRAIEGSSGRGARIHPQRDRAAQGDRRHRDARHAPISSLRASSCATRPATSARHHLELAERLLGAAPERVDLGMLRIGQSRLAALEGDGRTAVERARDALALLGDFHGDTQGAAVHALAQALALEGDDTGANDAYRGQSTC